MTRILSRYALAACAVLITACSAKKEIIAPPTPVITITAATTTLAVVQATSGSSVITVGRTNFAGDVNLTAEGLPTGVTATFTPATLSSGATASSVSLAAASNAPIVTTPVVVTIRAKGTGVTDATATISLTVSAVSAGAMSITATPATAAITAGQSATTAIAITRTGGFTGGVNFTVTGAKTGVTTTFSSANPVTANTVNLSIATLASVAAGPDTLVVRANATGLTEATATYIVTVAAPPSNSVTWRFCDPTRFPIWFAVQNGASGTWQRVSETAVGSGQYTFAYDQPRVGVATVMNDNSTVFTQVTYYGTSEIAAEALTECKDYPAPGTKSLSGTIAGFANANEVGLVSMGAALSSSANSSAPTFSITKVPSAAVDLIAVRANIVTSSVQRVLISRGTTFAPGQNIGTLDLAAGTSFAPGTGSLTITAPNDGTLFGTNVFTTATGSSASFSIASLSSGVAANYQGVPDANMIASDLQEIQVSQSVGTTISRFITRYTRGPGAFSLAMPLDPAVPTISTATGAPYARATATGSVSASFNNLIAVQFEQSTRRWEMVTTSAGRAAATTYSFTMPDFSALPGWQNTWGLSAGSADVTSSFFGLTGANPDGTPITGTQIVLTGRFNTFTFP